jgi:hypothetical protein
MKFEILEHVNRGQQLAEGKFIPIYEPAENIAKIPYNKSRSEKKKPTCIK